VVSKDWHEDVARLILKGLSQCADLSQLPPVVIKVYGLVAVREVEERRQVRHIIVLVDDHEQLCPGRIQEILCHLDVLWVASDGWGKSIRLNGAEVFVLSSEKHLHEGIGREGTPKGVACDDELGLVLIPLGFQGRNSFVHKSLNLPKSLIHHFLLLLGNDASVDLCIWILVLEICAEPGFFSFAWVVERNKLRAQESLKPAKDAAEDPCLEVWSALKSHDDRVALGISEHGNNGREETFACCVTNLLQAQAWAHAVFTAGSSYIKAVMLAKQTSF